MENHINIFIVSKVLGIYRFERIRAGESRIRKRPRGTQFSAVRLSRSLPAANSASNKSIVHQLWGSRAWKQNFNSRIPVRILRRLREEQERDEATEGNSGRSARFYLSRPCLLSTGDNRRESLPGMLSRLSSATCSHRISVASESQSC